MLPHMAVTTPQTPLHPLRIGRRGRLLDLHAVAEELGCSYDTVDRFIRAGKLSVVRLPSGRRRIDREDLDRAIADWKASSR
jgi:excisionase family DNA binding protein